jgi:hypothetical protein
MKNFMIKLLNNKIFFGILGALIAFAFIFQEKCLGDLAPNVFLGSPIISLISGGILEGFVCAGLSRSGVRRKYEVWNVASWTIGGIICSIILALIW